MFMNFMKKLMKNDKVLVALFVVLLVTFVFLYRKNMGYSWDKFSMPNMPKVNNVVEKEIEAAKKKVEEEAAKKKAEEEAAKKKAEEAESKEEPVTTKVEPKVAKEEPATTKVEPEVAKEEPEVAKEEPLELTKTSNNLNIENQLVVDPPTEKKTEPPKDEMVLCDNSETCPEDHWCYNNMCVGFASKCQEVSNEENKKMEEFTNSKTMETALLEPVPSVTTISSGALY